jgi:RNA polymerase sigma-70 factor (ECF subfamily)
MPTDIPELIRLARNGSGESLGELLNRYRNYLKLLASSRIPHLVQGRAGSSDVVQEVCFQAHQSFGQFRGSSEGEFLCWLRAVLASRLNRLLEQHVGAERRDVRREHNLQELANSLGRSSMRLEEMLIDREPSPSSALQRSELLVALSNIISELPDDYRQVLLLRHIDGLSFNEVASRLERSPGATRMLWFRAMDRLRELLSQRGLI